MKQYTKQELGKLTDTKLIALKQVALAQCNRTILSHQEMLTLFENVKGINYILDKKTNEKACEI